MPRLLASVLLLLAAGIARAGEIPTGWFLTGPSQDAYAVAASKAQDGSKAAELRSTIDPEGGNTALIQAVRADAFRGKRVRLAAKVKTQDVASWAALWLRADRADGTVIALDNMKERPLKGTTDWQPYTLVLDIPPTTALLVYGLQVVGTGAAWIDDVKVDVVDSSVEVTWAAGIELPKRPIEAGNIRPAPENLSFEAWTAVAAPVPALEDTSHGPTTAPVRY